MGTTDLIVCWCAFGFMWLVLACMVVAAMRGKICRPNRREQEIYNALFTYDRIGKPKE